MTLHEAIEKVLEKQNRPMSAMEISTIINSKQLYIKRDKSEVLANQISVRVNKYPRLFSVDRNVMPYQIKLANRRYE